jgi:uncharacterized protein
MLEIRNDSPIAMTRQATDVQPLKGEHEAEVLDFLSAHPLFTFVMTGWIKDNGLESHLNRGTFYGSRNAHGELNGVALIGHITMFETSSDAVLAAFADLAKKRSDTFVIMGEDRRMDRFMSHYSLEGQTAQRTCRELLFAERSRESSDADIPTLRRAMLNEIDLVVPVHAQMAFEQTGVNPLDVDAQGFRERCARRVQQGRVWVCIEDGKLVFKADVISDLAEVNYLEGIYVSPENRGRGLGSACMRQLTNILLSHTKTVCLLTGENESVAQACYMKAGYKLREYYKTVFLQEESNGMTN